MERRVNNDNENDDSLTCSESLDSWKAYKNKSYTHFLSGAEFVTVYVKCNTNYINHIYIEL